MTQEDDTGPGSFWKPKPPQRAQVARQVNQYSRFVSIMKIALPVAAGLLLLVVLGLPLIREQEDRIKVPPTGGKDANGRSLSMTKARYFGTDDKGQPYSVTAESVRQGAANDKTIELNQPKAEITTTTGNAVSASANAGIYDHDKQEIELNGDVALYQKDGNELHTSQAHITLKDGSARGNAKITGKGSFGTLEASGFIYNKDDQVIRFTGPARLILNAKGADAKDPSVKDGGAKTAPPAGAPK
ncbi:MAG: LPS export ABC transporter periplasmic protein LptC [Rhodospirillaceae bacterium]